MRIAGVCGPAQSTARPATLAEVDAWLKTQQLERTGDYSMVEAYDGLRLSAPVVPVQRPTFVFEPEPYNA